jgi:hypothetical protein
MTVGETVSIGLGFLAIVAPDFWPKMPRALSYKIAAIGLSWLVYSGVLAIEDATEMKLTYGPLITIVLGAAVIAAGVFWHISRIHRGQEAIKAGEHSASTPSNKPVEPSLDRPAVSAPTEPPKLEELFAKDFNFMSVNRDLDVRIESQPLNLNTTVRVKIRVFRDFSINSEFIAAFIPLLDNVRLSEQLEWFVDGLKPDLLKAREELRLIGVKAQTPGESLADSKDLTFSGRAFIYTMNPLDAVQTGNLVSSYRRDGMFLEIRGSNYLFLNPEVKRFLTQPSSGGRADASTSSVPHLGPKYCPCPSAGGPCSIFQLLRSRCSNDRPRDLVLLFLRQPGACRG